MRLEIASSKAIRYACMNFHYAKRMPNSPFGYSVFNGFGDWCGVVLFGRGNVAIEKPFGVGKGQAMELIRVALNGKQKCTSKVVSTAVKMFRKSTPLVRILVSYADKEEGHNGTIYQAMNWIYLGEFKSSPRWYHPKTGQEIHDRNVTPSGLVKTFNGIKKGWKKTELIRKDVLAKHKYIYPLDKSLIPLCKSLSKPYPKNASEVNVDKHIASSNKIGGSSPTHSLN
jgi:hypothetical protein